ncbi:MAG: hypothetical protein MUF87_01340 [Anaerolineae bacterium]|jgi:hypothetical protein|nr:hypothetical protein [Anaerolineae bacterium]
MTDYVDVWQQVILGTGKSWVVFEHGTCVILMQPEADLIAQAKAILTEYGPVLVGSPAGDFSVIRLPNFPGWVVTGHHPDILNYVAPEDVNTDATDSMIGLLGRDRRDQDAHSQQVIAVHDVRP